jgi:deoxyadenosine/deoxycytidine kinase
MSSAEVKAPGIYIALAGLIGVGKSTLAKDLGDLLNVPTYYEPVMTNPYLADFYVDMKSNAFAMQIYLFNKRYEQQKRIFESGQGAVQDRTL